MRLDTRRLVGAMLAVALGSVLGIHAGTMVRAAGTDASVTATQSAVDYKVDLGIGLVQNMMTPDQVTSSSSGEVMLQARPITRNEIFEEYLLPKNHHVEIHIHALKTGAIADGVVPLVTVTNLATHRSYILDDLAPMYDAQTGKADLHYGTNMYLPPSTHRITVVLDRINRVTFSDVSVTGYFR